MRETPECISLGRDQTGNYKWRSKELKTSPRPSEPLDSHRW